MIKPKFKESVHVEVLEPDTIFLVSENSYHLLTGSIYKQLAPYLRGEYTVPAIVGLLAGEIPPAHVMYALKKLEANGHIVEADDQMPPAQTAFWHSLGINSQTAADLLQRKTAVIQSVGEVEIPPLTEALQSLDVQMRDTGDLLVVITDDYLHEDLAAINQQALAANQTWLLVKFVGEMIWIGPVFEPYKTACWACMAQRIRHNRPVETYILKRRVDQTTPLKTARSALEATGQLGANMAATEIAKWLVQGHTESLYGRIMTLDTLSMEMQIHAVVQRLQCPACGTPANFRSDREPEPVKLVPCPKKFTWDGGHRSLLPEQAFAMYEHHISPITGVVTHLFNTLPESEGLAYSFIAGHDFSLMTNDVRALRRNMQGRSSGKGMTKIQAKMSAIGEAMERYSGVFRAEGEITKKASYHDLSPHAIRPNDVWLISQHQYENRIEWNRKQKSTYHLVHKPFDESAQIEWTPFWSLTNETFKYYPTFSAYFGHPDLYLGYGTSHSNGCAAGHTREEAIYQGLLELVERDSVAIWWYNCIKRPRVDLDSFGIPYTREIEAYYQKLNRCFWVLDITADLGIPTFVAVSGRLNNKVEDIIVGLGAHLDPKIALLRAISEANQFLSNVYYTNPDGTTRYLNEVEETVAWFLTSTMANQPYLVPDDTRPAKTLADYPLKYGDDLLEDIETCKQLLQDAGLEMLVIDQSRPDVGMKVCRVLVPGLRHFWRRLGPGRLYDVPVKLGWLNEPMTEEALNPVSFFF